MEELEIKKYGGVDLGKSSVQFSIYFEGREEMTEESFPIPPESRQDYIAAGIELVKKYMEVNRHAWSEFSDVNFVLEDASETNRDRLRNLLVDDFRGFQEVKIITRFRAFAEYVFHQERIIWDRNTLLLDYHDHRLRYILIDQLRRSRQKAYHAVEKEINLDEYHIVEGAPDQDQNFGQMMKRFLVKHPANIIFLTGEGFEGDWMKKTLSYLCAGRRVFLGQNLYANGACLLGVHSIELMDEGMILLDGPEMVYHTVGVVTAEAGKPQYLPITSIGREWYNTRGSVDIILDKSQRVEFFYHNTKENEMEGAVCEVTDLPKRPPKTTRIRIEVSFTSQTEGVILLTDLGFGEMFPATGKIIVFPFSLVS
ncbi:MAG: DUF5716 family protein [Eubacterium sp.]|nr:DUF5716 family protein [Eubacterium sp.]MDD7209984.1 DUF5716 family protein [Lachnospiraceae bacterium]MDY5496532.1 DUF5716 family protein [Anaerobutyricum sp.]